MTLGIECLVTDDAQRAADMAQQLDAINRERREVEAGMREQAEAALEHLMPEGEPPPALALFDPEFHEGVVGIVAGRLKDRLHRPTFVFAAGAGWIVEGLRPLDPGFHLRDALDLVAKRHPRVLKRFGGHAMAAGCSIDEEQFDTSAPRCSRWRASGSDAATVDAAPAHGRPAAARVLQPADGEHARQPGLGPGLRSAVVLRRSRGAGAAPRRREAPEAARASPGADPRRDLVRPRRAGGRARAAGLSAVARRVERAAAGCRWWWRRRADRRHR